MDQRSIPGFPARLRELREKAKMTQQALATSAGLSISNIAQIEQGLKDDPHLSTVMLMAESLGVDLNRFVSGLKVERGKPRKPAAGGP